MEPSASPLPVQADTRTRVRDAATLLFRRQGYAASGLKQIATTSAAPFGSIYHFFPGGKAELAEDVIASSGRAYGEHVLAHLASVDDPCESLVNAFDRAAAELEASGWADACPIATVAAEVASTNERLRLATAGVFEEWVLAGTGWFGRWVSDPVPARRLAQTLVMVLAGAFLISRARRDPEPLHTAELVLADLTRSAMASGESSTTRAVAGRERPQAG